MKEELTILEAGVELKISPNTVRRRIKDGTFNYIVKAGKYLIKSSEIRRLRKEGW